MNRSDLKLVAIVASKSSASKSGLDEVGQCDWVTRHGTEGYLCCAEARGHDGQHRTVYDRSQGVWPESSPYEWWYPLAEWERNFGAAARSCYTKPGWIHENYKEVVK